MWQTKKRVSSLEIKALIAEINNRSSYVTVSLPLPDESVKVFIVFRNGKFHETKKFGHWKPAKEFLLSILSEVNS